MRKPALWLAALVAGIGLPGAVAAIQPTAQEQSAAEEEYLALTKDYNEARKGYYAALRKWKEGDPELTNPAVTYTPHFVASAARLAGTEDAVRFLTWIVQNAPYERPESGPPVPSQEKVDALETLLKDHIGSEGMGDLASKLSRMSAIFGDERTLKAFARIVDGTPHNTTRVSARRARADMIMRSLGEKHHKTALADLQFVAEKGDDSAKSSATRALYELKHLQVGMVAPDIEGEDLDGVAFKLSDYRGKVVLLDFWGDW